eukprot:TRINITY_DN17534_c0_g1_i1.p1 TRINITY_DN17534_c0_g1~~TRINITY_DN17534_c0_g1_i1.p1  ORF type:complete len:2067 (-),score=551.69 TRINITY_DN17534_c0_g1_i1:77-6199(-)
MASFMFSAAEASRMDLEAVHALAMSGLSELVRVEPRLEEYVNTLFSAGSRNIARELLTVEATANLDERLDTLLLLLSPHFLLPATHKVIEYLVRNYLVYQYNVDSVLRCALPYHETKTFGQLLRILDKRGRWAFLARVSNTPPGTLSRATLVRQCRSDPSLAMFVCELAEAAQRQNTLCKSAVSLYLLVALELLRDPSARGPLDTLLPHVLHGVASGDPDFQSASYLILCHVASKAALADGALRSVLAGVLRHAPTPGSACYDQCLLCLAFLCRSQRVSRLPERPLQRFLAAHGAVDALTAALGAFAAKSYDVRALITTLHASLPAEREAGTEKLRRYIGLLVDGDRRFAESDALALAVRAPDPAKRRDAIARCAELDTSDPRARAFLETALAERLRDDDDDVLAAVLALPSTAAVLDPRTLFTRLTELVAAAEISPRVRRPALGLLTHGLLEAHPDLVADVSAFIFNMLLVTPGKALAPSAAAVREARSVPHPLFAHCRPAAALLKGIDANPSPEQLVRLDADVVASLARGAASDTAASLPLLRSAANRPAAVLAYLVLCRMLEAPAHRAEVTSTLIPALLKELSRPAANSSESKPTKEPDENANAEAMVTWALAGCMKTGAEPEGVVLAAPLLRFAVRVAFADYTPSLADIDNAAAGVSPLALLREIFAAALHLWPLPAAQELVRQVAARFAKDGTQATLLRFLAGFWLGVDEDSQNAVRALGVAAALLAAAKKPSAPVLLAAFPSLLAALTSPHRATRTAALSALAALRDALRRCSTPSPVKDTARFYAASESPAIAVAPVSKLLAGITAMATEFCAAPGFLQSFLYANMRPAGGPGEAPLLTAEEARQVAAYVARHATLLGGAAQLHLMEALRDVPAIGVFGEAVTVLSERLSRKPLELDPLACRLLDALFRVFSEDAAASLNADQRALGVLITALKSDEVATVESGRRGEVLQTFSPREAALQRVIAVWPGLGIAQRRSLFDALCDVQLSSQASAKAILRDSILKVIDLTPDLLAPFLSLPTKSKAEELFARLSRAGVVLEVVQLRDGDWNLCKPLLPPLFAVLRAAVDPANRARAYPALEYLVQQLLAAANAVTASIAACSEALSAESAAPRATQKSPARRGPPMVKKKAEVQPEQSEADRRLAALRLLYDIDAVVSALRAARSPQVQSGALALLSSVAALEPQLVLGRLRGVLDVVGTSALLRGDASAAQAILRAVAALVPPMARSEAGPGAVVSAVVAGLKSVPQHRRLDLFATVVSALGAELSLAPVLVALLLSHVADPTWSEPQQGTAQGETLVTFAHRLCLRFAPVEAANALVLVAEFAAWEGARPTSLVEYVPSLGETPAEKLAMLRNACVAFLADHLADRAFVAALVRLTPEDEARLQLHFLGLFERLIALGGGAAAEDAGEALSSLKELLTVRNFVGAVNGLLAHPAAHVRHTALVLLNEKLVEVEGTLTADEARLFIDINGLLGVVASMVSPRPGSPTPTSAGIAAGAERELTRQTALMILEILARNFAAKHPDGFVPLLNHVIVALRDENGTVAASAVICLATFVSELGPLSLPYVSDFMTRLLERLEETLQGYKETYVVDTQLQQRLSCLSALEVIVRHMAPFLSPYIPRLLSLTLHPAIIASSTPAVKQAATRLFQLCASALEYRNVFPAVFALYTSGSLREPASVVSLFRFLQDVLAKMLPQDARTQHPRLFKFFLTALDSRRLLRIATNEAPADDYDERQPKSLADVEFGDGERAVFDELQSAVVDAVVALVLKLDETSFKPLFLKVVDLVSAAIKGNDTLQAGLLFRLVAAMADRLRSIFVPYYGYLLDDMVVLLCQKQSRDFAATLPDGEVPTKAAGKRSHEEMATDALLRRTRDAEADTAGIVLDALAKCFAHDSQQQRFVDSPKLERLLAALCDGQLDNCSGLGRERYLAHVEAHVVPCVGHLAAALSGEKLWKPLNYQLLLRTRDAQPEVRLAALHCVSEVWRRLGVEMVALLPETLPFLAEVMEDPHAGVEQAAQQLAALMQSHLGAESLKDYL